MVTNRYRISEREPKNIDNDRFKTDLWLQVYDMEVTTPHVKYAWYLDHESNKWEPVKSVKNRIGSKRFIFDINTKEITDE